MKSLRLAAVLSITFFLVGCVQSLQPWVKETQASYDASLIGKWADDEGNTVVITGDEAAHSYEATMTEKDGKVGKFDLRIGKVQNKTIVDITAADPELGNASDMYKSHLLKIHSFLLLEKTASGVRITSMDEKWLGHYLEQHPDALAHVQTDDRTIFTAETDQLQDFILKHVDTDGAYDKPTDLKHVESPPATATSKP